MDKLTDFAYLAKMGFSGKIWAWMLLCAYASLTLHDLIPHHHSEDLHAHHTDHIHHNSDHDHHDHGHEADQNESEHYHLSHHQKSDAVATFDHGPKDEPGQVHFHPTAVDWVHSHGLLYRPPVTKGYKFTVSLAIIPTAFLSRSIIVWKDIVRPFDGQISPPGIRHQGEPDPRGPPTLA
jgi:hypothetical protein